MNESERSVRWAKVVPAGYSAVLTLLIMGPLLGPGYLLLRDAVSTPRAYRTDAALGLGDAAPRAVPQDAALAVLSSLVDGGLVVKAILLVALWAAGYGAAALVRELLHAPLPAQLVACTVALWNPYLAERLLQGHWSLLTGYAALPWIILTTNRIRAHPHSATNVRPPLRDWAGLAGALAAAGLTPTGAVLGTVTALVVVGWRRFAGVAVLAVIASAPWLSATAVSGAGSEPSDPAGIAAFAARAEPGLGTVGSLAGLGGIWNGEAVPDSRTTPLGFIGTLLLLAIVATGLRALCAAQDNRYVHRALIALAAAAILLPALGATSAGMHLLEWLVAHIPGTGLLRDTQKYVALAMPAYALCAAAACITIAARFRYGQEIRSPATTPNGPAAGAEAQPAERQSTLGKTPSTDQPSTPVGTASADRPTVTDPASPAGDSTAGETAAPSSTVTSTEAGANRVRARVVAGVCMVLLLLPLADLGWGVGGALRPVRYPAGWQVVAERVTGPGDVAVLPGGMFRKFRYSGPAPVLDPAPRMLPRDVLQTGELPVRGRTVAGEGTRARTVEGLLLHGGSAAELAAHGVGWVLLERATPGPLGESKTTLAQLDQVYADNDLALYRVPGPIDERTGSSTDRLVVIAAHILWAAMLLGGLLLAAAARMTGNARIPLPRRRPRPGRRRG